MCERAKGKEVDKMMNKEKKWKKEVDKEATKEHEKHLPEDNVHRGVKEQLHNKNSIPELV